MAVTNTTLHSQLAEGARHALHNLTYPDATNREAGTNEGSGITLATANNYQIAKQDDDDSMWMLLDYSGPTWTQLVTMGNAVTSDITDGVSIDVGNSALQLTSPGNAVVGGSSAVIDGSATVYSSVLGGDNNQIQGTLSTDINDASWSVITGGFDNKIRSVSAMIGSGSNNLISDGGSYGFIGGGLSNSISGEFSVVLGGNNNDVEDDYSAVLSGRNNVVNTGGTYGAICGGEGNNLSGAHSSILGGYGNTVSGDDSHAIGTGVTVTANGSVGLCDKTLGDGAGITVSTADRFGAYFTNGFELMGGNIYVGDYYNASYNARINTVSNATNSSMISGFNSTGTHNRIFNVYESSNNHGVLLVMDDSSVIKAQLSGDSALVSYVNNGNNFGVNTSTPVESLDINGDVIRLRTTKTPASASDTGTQGSIAWDSNYIYVCVATNTWQRAATVTW